jgi:ubiquinone/menaquinone biosynthesis C-methylase UbiE
MKSLFDIVFVRQPHVCPWWCCFTFDNPVRELFQNPVKILSPLVHPGFSVVDIGPGMGYFTVPLCSLVGNEGRVTAVDIQQKMLDATVKRATAKGVADRLETRLASGESLNITERADFVLAFWMVHEVTAKARFFREIAAMLSDTGCFLMVEPLIHVSASSFSKTVGLATDVGLQLMTGPHVALSRSALFLKEP